MTELLCLRITTILFIGLFVFAYTGNLKLRKENLKLKQGKE